MYVDTFALWRKWVYNEARHSRSWSRVSFEAIYRFLGLTIFSGVTPPHHRFRPSSHTLPARHRTCQLSAGKLIWVAPNLYTQFNNHSDPLYTSHLLTRIPLSLNEPLTPSTHPHLGLSKSSFHTLMHFSSSYYFLSYTLSKCSSNLRTLIQTPADNVWHCLPNPPLILNRCSISVFYHHSKWKCFGIKVFSCSTICMSQNWPSANDSSPTQLRALPAVR